MRPYETLVVLSNDLGAEIRPLIQRFETLIRSNGGTLDANHDWGNRRLAYPIKKKTDGRYFLFEYTAEPPVVSELERTLRITDGILRYMTVQQEHTGLPQARPKEPTGREDVPLSEVRSVRGAGLSTADRVATDEPGVPSEDFEEADTSDGEKPNE